jgi:hypothetical protein
VIAMKMADENMLEPTYLYPVPAYLHLGTFTTVNKKG